MSAGKLGVLVVSAAVALVAIGGAGASAGSAGLPTLQKGQIGKPLYARVGSAQPLQTSNTIPFWSSSFTDPTNGVTYPFTMVGTNPATSATTTTVPTVLIPLQVNWVNPISIGNDGTGDVSAVTGSPIFTSSSYVVSKDTGQYGSVIMRSEFNTFGNYNVNLGTPTVLPTQTIDIPANQGQALGFAPDGHLVGVAQINYFSNKLLNLINNLHISPTTLPAFLPDNVYLYFGHDYTAPGPCCVLGYHGATSSTNGNGSQGVQTFVFASWISSGVFSGGFMCPANFKKCGPSDAVLADIHGLSHEISEWSNDPFGTNVVQPWAVPTAPQYGCTNVLETGDPVVGIGWEQVVNGTTYHPEDEVFKSWFARENPSTAQNSNYTYMGKYNPFGFDTYPAPTC